MKINFVWIAIILLIFNNTDAQNQRNLLSGKISEKELDTILISHTDWHPYPKIEERRKWDEVPVKIRNLYIHNGEQYLGKSWKSLPATVFLDFVRNGNRSRYENMLFGKRERLVSLVLAEIFENKGRFVDDIANGVWSICEETFWGAPAHLNLQRKGHGLPDVTDPAIDLFAAETGAMLAYIYCLMEDRLKGVSPRITERILIEEKRRIINPYLTRIFPWEGRDSTIKVNNWNPWINSNLLAIVLLLDDNSYNRNDIVYKIMQSIDAFINGYPDDGWCDEGPVYWSVAAGAMFNCLDILYSATGGKINLFQKPLIQKMGQYIYKAWIDNDYYINFADASAIVKPDAGLVFRFGKRINDPLMNGFSALLGKQQNIDSSINISRFGSLNNTLPDLFLINEIHKTKPIKPFLSEICMPGRQIMAARSIANSSEGLYVAAKGGNNDESHNHNDVGNFIIYCDGKPVLIDAGVGTYTKKTFSKDRYNIWTMQSQYHNLPTINGVQQKNGKKYHAENADFSSNNKKVNFSLEIAKSYPIEAGVISWKRNIDFIRNSQIVLTEKYLLKKWKEPFRLNFLTPLKCDTSVRGKVILFNPADKSKYQMIYDSKKFAIRINIIKLDDERLKNVWGEELERVVLISKERLLKGSHKIEISKI